MAIEVEKKYPMTAERQAAIVRDLESYGAVFEGEDSEENTIFGGGILDVKGAVLRIRRTADRTILTFKQRIETGSDAKHQIEHEVKVDDAASLRLLVESLGFVPRIVYEKRRRTWKFRSVEVVLDELPFGLYMEIEGSLTAIKEAEMLLGIEGIEVENDTYPRLTARLGRQVGDVIEARFGEK